MSSSSSRLLHLLQNAPFVFASAVLLRVAFLIQGYYQDHFTPFKFTDIDYFVFTDASRFLYHGGSPYKRETYRYTPLLAWLLVPTAWSDQAFSFGKVLFAVGDIVTGWLIIQILRTTKDMSTPRAVQYSCLWLLNPMVATISTRGSSEGLLAVIVIALLWAALRGKVLLTGCLLGLAVHFKIYPFIYAVSIAWWMDQGEPIFSGKYSNIAQHDLVHRALNMITRTRCKLAASSLAVFTFLNAVMFLLYGDDFLQHTFFYHLIRTDHRHNFSPYHLLLYLNSSPVKSSWLHPETFAFLPQLLLSAVAIPIALAKHDLPSTMLAQTLAFVSFNKVCTSQYFLWYLVLLPFYLPDSILMQKLTLGFSALILWVVGQAVWLYEGYLLEFLGLSTFTPGLWVSSIGFFAINSWILGLIVWDTRNRSRLHVKELKQS